MLVRLSSWAAFLVMAISTASFSQGQTTSYKVDPVHSFLVFRIKHLDLNYVWGMAIGPTGTVAIDDSDPSKSAVEVSVKAESINTGNAARDQDLKGPDFFDAKQFPTISFKSTSMKKSADNAYEVAGDLTIHGVTKPLTVTITKLGEGDKGQRMGYLAGFETSFAIKRSDFGITAMMGGVGDEVTLSVNLECVRS